MSPSFTEAADQARDRHAALVKGLRALADFFEQHPTAATVHIDARQHFNEVDAFINAARELDGHVEQSTGSVYVEATRDFGGGVAVHYQALRDDTCIACLDEAGNAGRGKVVWELPPELADLVKGEPS